MTGRAVPETGGRPGREAAGERDRPAEAERVGAADRRAVKRQAAGPLWLVRHGQSGWNVIGRIQGQSPRAPGLTETGREQAVQAAQVLAGQAPGAALVVASDLTRAAQTAVIVADLLRLPLELDPQLREQALGTLEGEQMSGPAGADGGVPDDVLDVLWDNPFDHPPGGESVAAMYERVNRALPRIAATYPGAELIIVTHGGPVRMATAARPPTPGQPFPRSAVANASIVRWPPDAHRGSPG
jgi:2,3-bisphosphoglycerate-dependent phosphoglycerate mutase